MQTAWGETIETRAERTFNDTVEAVMLEAVARLLRRDQRAASRCGCDHCHRRALETIAWAERIARPRPF